MAGSMGASPRFHGPALRLNVKQMNTQAIFLSGCPVSICGQNLADTGQLIRYILSLKPVENGGCVE